ncbi:hypothetical protein VMCG_00645 [Cytospora schulzeri]|uniref:Vacuolar import and degradation protein 21 n=1 Tax=Cytospora schulzeri TaxID=448051 RepID=A0A423XA61_9PEZI|nr:hypothetical protein VMCG_00645 [Valsa malicola]
MTEVDPTGLSALIQASKKRKLHELYCVAAQVGALPLVDTTGDGAHPTTEEEARFLDDNAVLQGPFLNERNLPPRRIPPFKFPKSHDTTSRPGTHDAPFEFAKQSKENGIKPIPPTLGPEAAGVRANSIDKRDTSPMIPQTISPVAESSSIAESSPRLGREGPMPKPESMQTATQGIPEHATQHGGIATGNFDASGKPPAMRSGVPGREVSFVEPDQQRADSHIAHGAAQDSHLARQGGEEARRAVASDAMGSDEALGRSDEQPRLNSLRPPPLDASRPPDIVSSPGSTAQTATTPAVQDASPDTSPDNEGSQYDGDDDDLVRSKVDGENHGTPVPRQPVDNSLPSEGADPAAARAASLQLLHESTNAATSGGGHESSTPVSPAIQANGVSTAVESDGVSAAQAEAADQAALPPKQAEMQPSNQHQPSDGSPGQVANSSDADGQTARLPAQHPVTSPSASMPKSPSVGTELNSKVQAPQTSLAETNSATPAEGADMARQEPVATDSLFRRRSLAEKRSHKHNRTPTVIFEKPAKKPGDTIVASRPQPRSDRIPTDDYFVPLFFDGFTRQSQWMRSPEQLLVSAHKTISTPDCSIALHENQACKVLRRIYHLQQHDKWSLRQPKRCPEPVRPPSHWDSLLQEMKWMRTDFREERKWRRAVARNMAEACAEWVASSHEDRKIMQVNARIPPINNDSSPGTGVAQPSEDVSSSTPVPDLVPSEDADSPMDVDDEPQDWNVGTVAPSTIFALQDDEVVFGLQHSAASDQLLDELPLYGAPLKAPHFDQTVPESDPDARWRRPALPLSKYVEGEMVLKPAGPPLKRSRYEYPVEDDEDGAEVVFGTQEAEDARLPPENSDVALFSPEMKGIRDRLHAGHQFRPPTESLMPLQSFFENRIGSQWTSAEDDELRKQVCKYSYNWSLVSRNISSNSLFVSGEERRTPWECFERWVALEGFPNDVARTQYFQTYQRRIDQAQRVILLANQNAQQAAGTSGAVVPKRRPTLPVRVERRTPRRYLALIDAMKKLAKKREAAAAKQQQNASNQSRRTSTEAPQQKMPIKTPEDYARARHEREKQMTEKIARLAAQQEAQRRAAMQGRSQNQMAVSGAPGTGQVARTAAVAHAAVAANPLLARQLGVAGQPRPGMPIPQQHAIAAQMAAAGGLVPQMPVHGIQPTPAQMAAFQAQQRMQRSVLEARRISDQQRQQQMANQTQTQMPLQHSPPQAQTQTAQQPQVTQAHPMPNGTAAHNSPIIRNTMTGINQNNYMINSVAPYTPNGMGMATSPGPVGMSMPNVPAGSPRTPGMPQQPRQFPPQIQAQLVEIENQIRAKHPNITQEQAHGAALQHLQQRLMQNQMARHNVAQTAMDAAAGSAQQQAGMVNGMAAASSPHQYAQMLRQHQQQQAAQAAAAQAGQPPQRQPSGGAATPMAGR